MERLTNIQKQVQRSQNFQISKSYQNQLNDINVITNQIQSTTRILNPDKINMLIVCKLSDQETNIIAIKTMMQLFQNNVIEKFYIEKGTYNNLKKYVNNTLQDMIPQKKNQYSKLSSQQQNSEDFAIFDGKVQIFDPNFHEFTINLALTIGGDGTILYMVNLFQNRPSPPIIAVQKGTLGFLCQYNQQDADIEILRIIDKIQKYNNLRVQNKMRIQGKIIKNMEKDIQDTNNQKQKQQILQNQDEIITFHSLNEIVISRGDQTHAIKLDIYLNNKYFTQFIGDGLILSTPTGTTAYSASAGGTIVSTDLRSISLTPICPLSLSFRPIILSEKVQIKIKISENSRTSAAKISGDGQIDQILNFGDTILIEQSNFDIPIITDKPSQFLEEKQMQFQQNQECKNKEKQNDQENLYNWMDKLKILLKWNSNFI